MRLIALAFVPQSDLLAAVTPQSVWFYDRTRLEPVHEFELPGVLALCFSPSGRLVAFQRTGEVLVKDVRARHIAPPLIRFERAQVAGHRPALAWDGEQTLFLEGDAGVERLELDHPELGPVPATVADTPRARVWTTLLLPRRGLTLYGLNDRPAELVRWADGRRIEPSRTEAGGEESLLRSVFAAAANAEENVLVVTGKSWPWAMALELEREEWRVTREVTLDVRGRATVCAVHPSEPLAATASLAGVLTLHDLGTGDSRATRGGFTVRYPGETISTTSSPPPTRRARFADSSCVSIAAEACQRYPGLDARFRERGLLILEVDIGESVDVETLSGGEVLSAAEVSVAAALWQVPGLSDVSAVVAIVHTAPGLAPAMIAEKTLPGARLVGICSYIEGGCVLLATNGRRMAIDRLEDEHSEWDAIYQWFAGLTASG